jgi:hypothetical protein
MDFANSAKIGVQDGERIVIHGRMALTLSSKQESRRKAE